MSRRPLLVAMLLVASGSPVDAFAGSEGPAMHRPSRAAARAPSARGLAALANADGWLNSPPLTAADLRGKVVLVDFWTYTCVNWLRTLPYVRAWAAKYRDRGLVVVGVHSPEFPFEKDPENVRRAVRAMRIEYPVALDGDHSIWMAFENEAWPALYFVDARGQVRRRQLGEGGYDQAERTIQLLLSEAGARAVPDDLVSVDARGAEVPADWANVSSPETYVRAWHVERFASPGGAVADEPHDYTAPAELARNEWALAGAWTLEAGAGVLKAAGGRIVYRFHARDLNLVMGPAARGTSVRFRVRMDGKPPGAAHGGDVDEQGLGTAGEQRLYQLIRQPAPIADRLFEIEFLDPGAAAFVFTFG